MIEEHCLGCGLLFRGRWPSVRLAQRLEPVNFGYQRVRLLIALLGTTCKLLRIHNGNILKQSMPLMSAALCKM